ncbi:MFS transporter [Mucilaginibacter arboris]|uniref:MFS transporter n=1 Tax=Mucilaginibacter arboris TaxID=2682090 RepID=A0A7K1SXU1_9SPHI|nr:MFS transporter [Mucilaginibacter arboris]MVN22067.1 MFS transporter [Mucilaginibacter arboris]
MNLTAVRALKYPNFRLYFSGQAISLIGTWMQRMAVSWLVFKLTHSEFMLGLVVFAGQIPIMLLSPYGGALTDRHSRYKVLLFTQISSMLQAGLLAAVVLTGHYDVTIIIILSVVLGIINAFDTPARQSLMINLVDDKKDLPNAIALNSSMVTLARLLGPVAAGIILSNFGEGVCFAANFISFVAVIASLLLMKIQPEQRKPNKQDIWEGLRDGYGYLQKNAGIRSVILLMACTSFFVMPYSTLLPVFATDIFHGNVTTFSWLNSISGLGALGGAVYMATLKPGKSLLKIIAYCSAQFSLSLILFALTGFFPLALCFIMAAEFGMLSQIAASNTYIQTHVDENMRGRVISYYVMAFQGMSPIGSLLIGFLAHYFGASLIVCAEGVAGVIAVICFIPYFKKAGTENLHGLREKILRSSTKLKPSENA